MTTSKSAAVSEEQRRQREWIDRAREVTGAREVILHEVPRWMRDAIGAALRRDGIRQSSGEPLQYAIETWRGLFDHWGTSQIQLYQRTEKALVTEPYGCGAERAAEALAFAKWVGCDVEIGRPSWWYPGNTVRIEFYPRVATT